MSDYHSPLWQRKRLEILKRDNFECVNCGDTATTLHVHHKDYPYGLKVYESSNDNLITLCKHCHSALGEHKKAGVWFENNIL